VTNFAEHDSSSLPSQLESGIKTKKLVKFEDPDSKNAKIKEFLENQLKIRKISENSKMKFLKVIDEVSQKNIV
jgi:hypothetical protein